MLEGEKVVPWLLYMLLPPQINKCEIILRYTAKMAPTKLADFVTWQGAGLEVDRSYPVSLLFFIKTGPCVCIPYGQISTLCAQCLSLPK